MTANHEMKLYHFSSAVPISAIQSISLNFHGSMSQSSNAFDLEATRTK